MARSRPRIYHADKQGFCFSYVSFGYIYRVAALQRLGIEGELLGVQ